MNRIALSSVLIILALAVFACGEDDTTGPSGPTSIAFPVAVGNQWVYDNTESSGGGSTDTTTIVGTELFDGQTFWVLAESGPDDDDVLLRQDGQAFYVIIPIDSARNELRGDPPVEDWVDRVLMESLPWKFAQFDAEAGESWAIAAADTTFDVEGTLTPLAVTVTGSSLGRQMVPVPAGSFDDSYHGRVILELTVDDILEQRSTQEIWVKDGIGLVKMSETDEGDNSDDTVSELVSYSLN